MFAQVRLVRSTRHVLSVQNIWRVYGCASV